jgi:nucleotide-binding universal stress UspA family protein
MPRSPTRFRCIVVPVDGSEVAEQAIPLALEIARRAQSNIRLVLVHQELSPVLIMEPGVVYTNTRLAMERSEAEYLAGLTTRLREQLGEAVSSDMLKGPIVSTLAAYTRTVRADLVVMTTHGRGGARRAWLGSITDELIRTLDVPVLAVRALEDGAQPINLNIPEILVPLDGSPLAELVLGPVVELARLWNARVSLVQIVEPVFLATEPGLPSASSFDEQLTSMQRDAARDYIRDIAEELREQGVDTTGVALFGGPTAETILELVQPERVGLIALATHGRGGLRRLLLGSVADKLVRAAQVPVLVVRPLSKGGGQQEREAHQAGSLASR